MVTEIDAALADCAEAKRLGAQIVEYRIDQVFSGSGEGSPLSDQDAERETREIERLIRSSPLPAIVTCRPTFEGGFYDGDDASRVSLYEHLGSGGGARRGDGRGRVAAEDSPRYIDVEFATMSRSANMRQKVLLAVDHPGREGDARRPETALILSAHDFERRPADLTRRLLAMRAEPAAKVIKIAYRARSLRDNLELFDILREADRPTIALGMGEFGLMSRVLAPKFGAFLTFASLRDASATAPGQPTITEILQRYRFRSISKSTRVYGVIGWPVGHSLSPLIHNAGFEAIGHDGVYLPLPIATDAEGADGGFESFKGTVLDLVEHEGLDFGGASVTIPHKENLVRLARELGPQRGWHLTPGADSIGAANTIVVERDDSGRAARVTVDNTDAPAIAALLADAIGTLRGRVVALLGAGGVARGAAHACATAGADVRIHARSPEQADRLASEISRAIGPTGGPNAGTIEARPWEDRHEAGADAVINCTPLGMKGGPAPDGTPMDIPAGVGGRSPHAIIFDTVYNPARTPLLVQAERAGHEIIDGVSMFTVQGAMQFRMWTGRDAPAELFERLVRARLGV